MPRQKKKKRAYKSPTGPGSAKQEYNRFASGWRFKVLHGKITGDPPPFEDWIKDKVEGVHYKPTPIIPEKKMKEAEALGQEAADLADQGMIGRRFKILRKKISRKAQGINQRAKNYERKLQQGVRIGGKKKKGPKFERGDTEYAGFESSSFRGTKFTPEQFSFAFDNRKGRGQFKDNGWANEKQSKLKLGFKSKDLPTMAYWAMRQRLRRLRDKDPKQYDREKKIAGAAVAGAGAYSIYRAFRGIEHQYEKFKRMKKGLEV